MRRKSIEDLPAEVKRLRVELEEWRARKRPGERIPDGVWSAAARAAGRHGLNRVSRALGLDYYHLKKRSGLSMEKAGGAGVGAPVFVELSNVVSEAADVNVSCVVELEKGNGAKLRVCMADAGTVDWCRLKEAFLGA